MGAGSQISEQDIAQLKRDALEYILPTFARNDRLAAGVKIMARGDGVYLYDAEGNKYLDTFASLLTTICGHHHPDIAAAIRAQLDEIEFYPNYEDTFTIPLIRLAKKLAAITPGELAVSFFTNSGSEANESALKMARQYHLQNGQPRRFKVIARRLSYHGVTLGGVSATGLQWFREYFEPLVPGCLFAPEARQDDGGESFVRLREMVEFEGPESISAIIMDPIPGSNTGYPMPPDGYMQAVRELCDTHGIILVFDEVQTSFGKSGRWFGCQHFDITPDIMTVGKGFAGGYVPLAAAIATPKIADSFRQEVGREFRNGITFGGHTLGCAAALAVIDVIEKNKLVDNAAKMGDYLVEQLETTVRRHRLFSHVSGIGLLRAINLVDDVAGLGDWIRDWCFDHGMILRNNGNILVFAPALIITTEQIDWVVDRIDQALSEAARHFGL